jgi:hypothetical protein
MLGFSFLFFLTSTTNGQTRDTSGWRALRAPEFYKKFSPLDFLKILRADFKRKQGPNVFVVGDTPDNWVREEHISGLIQLVGSPDSTKAVMSVFSSFLTADKFSTVGREAQHLIESFKTSKKYPIELNSFGPTDTAKAKELLAWWAQYQKQKR